MFNSKARKERELKKEESLQASAVFEAAQSYIHILKNDLDSWAPEVTLTYHNEILIFGFGSFYVYHIDVSLDVRGNVRNCIDLIDKTIVESSENFSTIAAEAVESFGYSDYDTFNLSKLQATVDYPSKEGKIILTAMGTRKYDIHVFSYPSGKSWVLTPDVSG